MEKNQIAVFTNEPNLKDRAYALAQDLALPYIDQLGGEEKSLYPFLLTVTENYLALQRTNKPHESPFYIDFLSQEMRKRFKQKGLRSEFLARAIGFHPRDQPFIVDATAGLGRDSFILSSLGFEVTLLEVSPIIYTLLKDALTRARNDEIFSPIVARMHLIHADAATWLHDHQSKQSLKRPDVIYLDPMFPIRKKTAASKKEMVILQELLRNCPDNSKTLLDLSLTCATHRVVVKRPRLSASLSKNPPDFSIKGRSSRFDIYLIN